MKRRKRKRCELSSPDTKQRLNYILYFQTHFNQIHKRISLILKAEIALRNKKTEIFDATDKWALKADMTSLRLLDNDSLSCPKKKKYSIITGQDISIGRPPR